MGSQSNIGNLREGTPQLRLESRIDCESAIVRSWYTLTMPLLMHLEHQLYEVGTIIEEYLFESKPPFSNDGDALHIWRTQVHLLSRTICVH